MYYYCVLNLTGGALVVFEEVNSEVEKAIAQCDIETTFRSNTGMADLYKSMESI